MAKQPALIYTDGSCKGNPGKGGFAVLIFDDTYPVVKLSGYVDKTTNQRMELTAVIEGLKYFRTKREITVCTDSAYIFNAFAQKWYNSWMLNGWKNADGKPVSNQDLWKEFIKLIEKHDVAIIKTKAHSDNIFNNTCDEMAKDIIDFWNNIKSELH